MLAAGLFVLFLIIIVDLDDTGAVGLSTIYYAEERKDVK